MKRVIDVDLEVRYKKAETALNRFFKKFPDLNYWREQFEYMLENNVEFESDETLNDGTYNKDWSWAVHCQNVEDWFYFAVIERA